LAAALALLDADVKVAEAYVLRMVKVPLIQGQFDALTEPRLFYSI
jgi:GH24 family phage-related lysozyme (muramidase)